MSVNRQWRLARRPRGMVQETDFTWAEEAVPSVGAGQFLVRNLYLSMDPTQRGWMSRDTYLPAIAIGEVIRSFGVGQVVGSRHEGFRQGDLVQGGRGLAGLHPVRRGRGSAARRSSPPASTSLSP